MAHELIPNASDAKEYERDWTNLRRLDGGRWVSFHHLGRDRSSAQVLLLEPLVDFLGKLMHKAVNFGVVLEPYSVLYALSYLPQARTTRATYIYITGHGLPWLIRYQFPFINTSQCIMQHFTHSLSQRVQ